MKKSLFFLLCILQILLGEVKAQNIAINTDGSLPDASSMLDIASTTKGFLAPRMTSIQQNSIASPAKGLLIYNTTDNTFKVNTGTSGSPVWTTLSTSSNDWLLTGNAGTNASTNFLGTTDNVNLNFRTNNLQRMLIDAAGKFGLGTSTFNATNPEKFLVDAGTTTSVNAIVGKGSIDSYLQLNIQNNSAGSSASSDVVATANNGNETSNYVDMGINGGSYSGGVMGAANDGYLYTMGNNFLLGTGNASKSLVFMTGGTSQSTNERMRIDGSGNVGIGVTNPSYKLQVSAASNPLQLSGLQTGSNGDSILTVSNGVVRRIHVSALATSSNAWSLVGNASTNPNTNFIGTTDAQALIIKENNTQVGRFDANSMALGNGATISNSTHSYALGSTATVGYNKTAAMALGNNSAINADSSFAIGTAAVTNGANSFAIGNGATSNNTNSMAIGRNALTAYSITDAVAIGTNATANASNSIAIGSNSTPVNKTATNAPSAIAVGNAALANSTNAIAIGTGAFTGYNLTNPVAIGVTATVNGNNGIAIGNGTSISPVSNATVIGAGASASSTANNSTAIGYNTNITKSDEIILGDITSAALSVGIGTEGFSTTNREKFLVDAGTTTSVNAIVGKGSIDSYLQLNIQNNSTGTSASSDVVATANNGNESTNYVDMGINGGSYAGGVMGAANDGYLYTMGNNFLLGTGNASKSLVFMTGGTSQSTNERMRIDGSGNVGIGVTNPSYKLQVSAASNPLQLSGLQTGTNTDSILTVSNGVVKRLSPSALSLVNAWALVGNTGSASAKLGTTGNFNLPFITNNTEKMRLTTGGNLGIGIASPNYSLHLHDATVSPSAGNWMQITNNATGTGGYDGFFYGVNQTGGPEIWAENNLDIFTGSGTTNNQSMRINPNGYVGIGTTTFNATNPEKLVVDAGTTSSVNAIVGKGSINSYLQLNIQNNSSGTSASSDVVATANNGNETNNYVDMGINGGNYSGGVMGAANDGYLYTMGNNFLLATGNASKSLVFMTGGTSQATNERMRIDGSGNVGIGVTSPAAKLHVSATTDPLLLAGLQTGTNTDSVLTVSNGVVKRLSPSALTTSSSNAWALVGNTGSATTKLGTTGAYDLPIITNNTTKMTITSSGNVGIGSTDFDASEPELLLVDGSSKTTKNIIGAYANSNNYAQIGIQNLNSGNSASSDIVATADNGTNTTNYIDMGINSSSYANNSSNILNRPNVGYLYTNATADFFIGNGAPNQDMIFFTNSGSAGNTTANGNEAVRIDGNGNVGIGGTSRNNSGVKTTNAEKLVVQGNIVPRTSGSGTIGTSTYKWNAVYATNGTIQTSDRRMKTNILDLKYGLKEIIAMRPVSFNWNATPNTNHKVGLIAQEVRAIIPEVVTGDEAKETLGLNYAELVPVLINAVKEQQKEIDELKKMVKSLINEKK